MGQNTKVIVTKATNYAASKTNAALNTALNPADLADGALGIYGIDPILNAGNLSLITDAAASSGSLINKADFKGKEVIISFGTSGNTINSNPIDVNGIKRINSSAYTAPVKGVFAVGYNRTLTSGSLEYASSGIQRGDEIEIRIVNQLSEVTGNKLPYEKERYSAQLKEGEGVYSGLVKLVNNVINRENANSTLVSIAIPKISSNTAGAAAANSATLAAVNGLKTLTSSAAHGIGVSDYVSIAGDLYQAVTGTAGTTLVLDRPYSGATGTITNATFLDLGASVPTELGIEITDKNFYSNIEVTVQGVIIDATLTKVVQATPGSGSFDHVNRLEAYALPMLGSHDQITSYAHFPKPKAVEGTTYDLYFMEVQNSYHPKGDNGSVFNVVNNIDIAFPSTVADTGGTNQSDFEDIITTFYPALVTLF